MIYANDTPLWAALAGSTSTEVKILTQTGTGSVSAAPVWASLAAYSTIQEEGAGLAQRSAVNFIGGSATCVDNPGDTRTDCTFTGGGSGGHTIQEEGTPLTARANLNFIGAAITATDDAGNAATKVTLLASPDSVSVVGTGRLINTSVPLGGGGALTADLTLTCVTCVTTVSATGPITSSGGTTPDIGCSTCLTTSSFANPSAQVGLTVVNGSATTAMRSDAAPPLNQGIVPTWTGLHTFNPGTTPSDVVLFAMAQPGAAGQRDSHNLVLRGTAFDTGGHNADWRLFADVTSDAAASSLTFQSRVDAASFASRFTIGDGGLLTATNKLTGLTQATGTTDAVAGGRTINTSAPLGGGGNLTGDLTLTCTTCVLTSRTLTAGAGLSGGGDLSADRSFATDSTETDFLISGALTCGASTQGKMKTHTTPLQYCDNAATPALQYAAYANSTGVATSALTSAALTANYVASVATTGPLEGGAAPGVGVAISLACSTCVVTTRTLTAGAGLSGGGDLSADRSFATDSTEADFLSSGALTCGASTQGKTKVHTTPLQYCDNAGTPALRYAAYGDSAGAATSGDTATAFFSTGTVEVAVGGTGAASFTAYAILAAGTTATGPFQNVSGLGVANQVLTSNGAGTLPTWQDASGGGANTALSNLITTNINQSLLFQTTLDVGSAAKPPRYAYLYGDGTYGTTSLKFTGTPTDNRTVTFQDVTGTVYVSSGTDVSLADGGTNASLTASNGGIFYSTTSAGAILAGTATANQVLLSGSSAAPAWSTATYPPTTTINRLLYSSAANVIADLATGNNGVLITSSGGVPSISSTIPSATQDNITRVGTLAVGAIPASLITGATFGAGTYSFSGSTLTTLGTVSAGALSGLTTLAIRDTSATFDVAFVATSSPALDAGRSLTLDMGNVAHTIVFGTTANTITFPNAASGTVALLNLAQTWTALQSFGTNLGGTLQTAAQPNVTSLGTLTGLTVSGTASFTNASPFSMTNGQVVTVALTAQTVGAPTLTVPNFADVDDTFAFLTLAQELDNKTLDTAVGKGTWTASGTWTLPAITLGGTVSGGGSQINNVVIGTSTPLAGTFTTLTGTAGSIAGLTKLAIRDTSAAFDVIIAGTSSTTLTADRTLTLDMGNVAHTLKFGTSTGTVTIPTGTVTLVDTTRTITGGVGIAAMGDLSADRTVTFDATELTSFTWNSNSASFTHTFDTNGTDPVWTYTSNSVNLTTGVLTVGGNTVIDTSNSFVEREMVWYENGDVAANTGIFRIYAQRNITLKDARCSVNTAGTTSAITVDVNKNGTTIFTTQASRPSIAAAGTTDVSDAPDVTTAVSGDYFTIDVDAADSGNTGLDLTCQLRFRNTLDTSS